MKTHNAQQRQRQRRRKKRGRSEQAGDIVRCALSRWLGLCALLKVARPDRQKRRRKRCDRCLAATPWKRAEKPGREKGEVL